jgi:hypothetical protein
METMSLPSVSEIEWHAQVEEEEEEDLETEAESEDFIVVGTRAISALKNALGDYSNSKSSLKLEELIYEICDRYSTISVDQKKYENQTKRLSAQVVLASLIAFYYSKHCKSLISKILKKSKDKEKGKKEKVVKTQTKQRVPMYHPATQRNSTGSSKPKNKNLS